VELLENGEALFPRALHAIETARHEVLLETFILDEDDVGRAFLDALIGAGRRGVRVELTIDAWGSVQLRAAYLEALAGGGVCVHRYGAVPRWRQRIAWFRRNHRKLMVVDGRVAYVGGINLVDSQMVSRGAADAKQDYAVEVRGPLVQDIRAAALAMVRAGHPITSVSVPPPSPEPDGIRAAFLTRNNGRRSTSIEREYRAALAGARKRVVIANPYFFPGYRILRALTRAARRGVDVRLILQGEHPDLAIARVAAVQLYEHLLGSGVRIFEYQPRALHGKVAVVDGEWATVGSSNLDPLSLGLNLEANVAVRDEGFATGLLDHLDTLMRNDCTEVDGTHRRHSAWRAFTSAAAFHVLRHFPQWAGWLPAHHPVIVREGPDSARQASAPTPRGGDP
jgi:cardiolipin synthase